MKTSDKIKLIREDSGLSMRAFGEKIGISSGAVSMIENGQREPSRRLLCSICMAYDISEEWLFNDTGDMFVEKSTDADIAEITTNLFKRTDISEDAKQNLVEIINVAAQMSEEQVNCLIAIAERLANRKKPTD